MRERDSGSNTIRVMLVRIVAVFGRVRNRQVLHGHVSSSGLYVRAHFHSTVCFWSGHRKGGLIVMYLRTYNKSSCLSTVGRLNTSRGLTSTVNSVRNLRFWLASGRYRALQWARLVVANHHAICWAIHNVVHWPPI